MAHQAIKKLAGNVVSGKGVVDATLDHRISTMGCLHHLESPLPVRGAHRKLPLFNTTFTQLLGFKTNSTPTTAVKVPSSTSS
jgi:hypothetical protein